MAYTPTVWNEGDTITAERLNKLERGVANEQAGPQGPPGVDGKDGAPGPQGPKGDTGPAGADGAQGPVGPAGATGPTGPAGPQGPKGDTGPQGPAGIDGTSFVVSGRYDTLEALKTAHPEGVSGEAYAVGTAEHNEIYVWNDRIQDWDNIGSLQGTQGPRGPQGIQGEQGEVGPQGPKRDTGATGPQGPTGPKGDPGATTADGVSFDPSDTGMAAENVQDAITELFTSGSEGKALIASAITAKGVDTSADATFQTMADNIEAISSGFGASFVIKAKPGSQINVEGISSGIIGSTLTAASGEDGTAVLPIPSAGTWRVSTIIESISRFEDIEVNGTYEVDLSSVLPKNYKQLEYIKSTGNQFVYGWASPSVGNMDIFIDFYIDALPGNDTVCLFGSLFNDGRYSYQYRVIITDTNKVKVCYGTDFYTFQTKLTVGRHTISLRSSNKTATYDNERISLKTASLSNNTGITIFASYNKVSGKLSVLNYCSMHLYSCLIKFGETVIRNFVPCVNELGNVGVYDTAGYGFMKSEGEGEFIAGPDV